MPKSNSLTKTNLKKQISAAMESGDFDKAAQLSTIFANLFGEPKKSKKDAASEESDESEGFADSDNLKTVSTEQSITIKIPVMDNVRGKTSETHKRKVTFISSGESAKEKKLYKNLLSQRDVLEPRKTGSNILGKCPSCKSAITNKNVVKTIFDGNRKECVCPKCKNKFQI